MRRAQKNRGQEGYGRLVRNSVDTLTTRPVCCCHTLRLGPTCCFVRGIRAGRWRVWLSEKITIYPHRLLPHSPACLIQEPPSHSHAPSHLAALGNDNIQVGHVLATVAGLRGLHLAHDVHAVDDLAKHDVFAVEKRRGLCGDEELGAVCVWARVLAGKRKKERRLAGAKSVAKIDRRERKKRKKKKKKT